MTEMVTLQPIPKGERMGRRRDEVVEQYLLTRILSGEMPPGTKFPSTAEMAAQMRVNINSVQKALMRLSARGFLTRKTNLGTFVNERDASPSNVFLLIGPCLREETCHFDRRLSKLIEGELFSRGFNPIIYDGLDQILDRNSSIGPRLARQLMGDLAHFDPRALVEQDFLSLRIPELTQGSRRQVVSFRPVAQGGDVSFDYVDFHRKAVQALVERGRRNVVMVLKNPKVSYDSLYLRAFWEAARERGLNVVKMLHIGDDQDEEAPEDVLGQVLTRELNEWKKLPPRKRWDSMIIGDDVLMRAAALCLLREGISVPDDIMPLSLVNEGIDLAYGIPIVGIEVPLSQMASTLIDVLDVRLGRSSASDPSPVELKGRVVDLGTAALRSSSQGSIAGQSPSAKMVHPFPNKNSIPSAKTN